MALSPKEMQQAIISTLSQKTGRDLDAWVALARNAQLSSRAELVGFLKNSHGVGHVTAQLIATYALEKGSAYSNEEKLLNSLFPGVLMSRYTQVEAIFLSAAEGVERVVCKTYVGFRRKKQFAAVRADGEGLLLAFALEGDARGLSPTRFKAGGRMTHELKLEPRSSLRALSKFAREAIEAI